MDERDEKGKGQVNCKTTVMFTSWKHDCGCGHNYEQVQNIAVAEAVEGAR